MFVCIADVQDWGYYSNCDIRAYLAALEIMQFLKFVEKTAPITVYPSGKGSSSAGLTASVIRDNSSNEMFALQKEQEDLDEVKCLSEKEICMKVLGKRSACVFSFKPTNREELEAENEKLKLKLQEMKATMASVKDMQKMINQWQDFQKRIEGVFPSTPTDASIY